METIKKMKVWNVINLWYLAIIKIIKKYKSGKNTYSLLLNEIWIIYF